MITLFHTFVSSKSNTEVCVDNLVMYNGKTPFEFYWFAHTKEEIEVAHAGQFKADYEVYSTLHSPRRFLLYGLLHGNLMKESLSLILKFEKMVKTSLRFGAVSLQLTQML